MPLNFPSLKELSDRTRTSVRNELPQSDPTIFGSFLRAITDGIAARAYDFVLILKQLLNQFFPQTAIGAYLERWAGYESLTRLAATPATGAVVIEGTVATTIPISAELTSEDGYVYTTKSASSVVATAFSITGITRSGSTATVTASDNPLATGSGVVISGANETEYNGTFTVTVIDEDSFSYTVSGSPASPATGTLSGAIDAVSVSVQSQESGQVYNLQSGAILSLVTQISGIDSIRVKAEGVVGGTDLETDVDLRSRVLESRANPVSNFNAGAIKIQARKVAGVTSVFVKNITPNVGDVTVYFFRKNDINPIPSTSEIAAVKAKIVEILPATSDESNVYVLAPTLVNTDFTFTAISPDTTTMRAAITANLEAFFEDSAVFETSVSEDKYRAAIIETQDTETGEFLQSFTLSAPAADITISDGEIAGLRTVTMP